MASLVHINKASARGRAVADAIDQIKRGMAYLKEQDGMRAQTIAVSAAKFGEEFGIADPGEAQAFSDRWAPIAQDSFAGLRDFLDATLAS